MSNSKKNKSKHYNGASNALVPYNSARRNLPEMPDPATLETLPISYQEVYDYFKQFSVAKPFILRRETMSRIEKATGRPLICYVTKIYDVGHNVPARIDDDDVVAFADLCDSVPEGKQIDIFLTCNGGSAEATARIVGLLRSRFDSIRYILPSNAFSAATLLCFSGDEIIMDAPASLGPIDPQINGVPARAILRGFEEVEKKLKAEGPSSMSAYVPLLNKYDLPLLELCKSANALSEELAKEWLARYMLKCSQDDERVTSLVKKFLDYDNLKSHGRGIDRATAKSWGLNVVDMESVDGLKPLVRSLHNQYQFFFSQPSRGFYKMFEDPRGNNWGRQQVMVKVADQSPFPPGSIVEPVAAPK